MQTSHIVKVVFQNPHHQVIWFEGATYCANADSAIASNKTLKVALW